jgi:hypothetical protein
VDGFRELLMQDHDSEIRYRRFDRPNTRRPKRQRNAIRRSKRLVSKQVRQRLKREIMNGEFEVGD